MSYSAVQTPRLKFLDLKFLKNQIINIDTFLSYRLDFPEKDKFLQKMG